MTTEEQEGQIIHWGLKAQELIASDTYIELFDYMRDELSAGIMDSAMSDTKHRESLFITWNGMRAFGNRLVELVTASHAILAAKDNEIISQADEEPDEDQPH